MTQEKRYTIGELSKLTGISRRSVRYYVQRGLVPPPLGAGRGHYYTDDHLSRILAIKDLQAQGFTLEEIEDRFRAPQPDLFKLKAPFEHSQVSFLKHEPAPAGAAPELPTLLTRVKVAEGVELTIESGTYRLSPARLRKLQRAVRDILGPGFAGEEEGEGGKDE